METFPFLKKKEKKRNHEKSKSDIYNIRINPTKKTEYYNQTSYDPYYYPKAPKREVLLGEWRFYASKSR